MSLRRPACAAAVGLLLIPAPAFCHDTAGIEVALNLSAVSDYRYRGVSLSDRNPAVQAELTVSHRSGVYITGWASSIAENGGSNTETQVAIGYSATDSGLTLEAWSAYYLYPRASGSNFGEFSMRLSRSFGEVTTGVLASYAPAQSNIGGTDNVYLGVEASAKVPGKPITVRASVGWENGAFAAHKRDWQLALEGPIGGFDCGLSYIGASHTSGTPNAKDTLLVSIAKSF